MKNYYYYADNDQQFGPFTIEELIPKQLKKTTLVWTEGMQDWATADSIIEIKDILIPEPPQPPPLPKKNSIQPVIETVKIKQAPIPKTSSKYDLTYEKEIGATWVGISIFILEVIIIFSPKAFITTVEEYNQMIVIFVLCSIVLRIGITFWVIKIATRQNRNSTAWGFFAFFFPILALIIIGQLKKLLLKIEIDGSLSKKVQVSILLEKVYELYSDKRYPECIEVLNKAIEIDSQNYGCIELRGIANYQMRNYEKSKVDFETLIENNKFLSDAYFYLGNLAIIDKDRELAVSYWLKADERNKNGEFDVSYLLKADEQNNDKLKTNIDLYHTFTGNYLLDKSEVNRKLTVNSYYYSYIDDVAYQKGLAELDKIENISSYKTHIMFNKFGVNIELKKSFKILYVAISFYEIDNIILKESENILELHLIDKNILTFSYRHSEYVGLMFKNLCTRFMQATGKKPDAANSWD